MRLANIVTIPLVIISIPIALFAVTFGADSGGILPFFAMGLPFLLAIPASIATYTHNRARYADSRIASILSFCVCGALLLLILVFVMK